jgi:hypothetical protein
VTNAQNVCFFAEKYFEFLFLLIKIANHSTPSSGQFHLLFLFFASIMFGISVSSLFFYHLFLTGKNRTTVGKDFYFPFFHFDDQILIRIIPCTHIY